ncbi:hypothetical protein BT69DRAFT_1292662 [Atractiella rhizophila]|nr:hypothetical protein BT69DRAFT_1292662 [Atractiella rhizophila]
MGLFSCQSPNAHDSLPRRKRPAKYNISDDKDGVFSPKQLLEKPNFPSEHQASVEDFSLPRPRDPGAFAADSIGRSKKYEIDFSPTGGIGTIRRQAGRAPGPRAATAGRIRPAGPRPRPASKNLGRSGTAKRIREMIGKPKDFVHKAHVGVGDLKGVKTLDPESFVAHYHEMQRAKAPSASTSSDEPAHPSSPQRIASPPPAARTPSPVPARIPSPSVSPAAVLQQATPPASRPITPDPTPVKSSPSRPTSPVTPSDASLPSMNQFQSSTPPPAPLNRTKTAGGGAGKRKAAPPVTASIIRQVGEAAAFGPAYRGNSPPPVHTSQPMTPTSNSPGFDPQSAPVEAAEESQPPTLPTKPSTPPHRSPRRADTLFPPEDPQAPQKTVQYDAQGRPVVAVVGDVEMSKTVKKEWDGALEFIQNALKMDIGKEERGPDGEELSVEELLRRREAAV